MVEVFPAAPASRPQVTSFFHEATFTATYVVADPQGRRAVIIDPVLDFDHASARTGTESAAAVARFVEGEGLEVAWILETHVHADHLTASQWLAERTGARIAIGAGVGRVQRAFSEIYNLGKEVATDGSQFDHLLADGETFAVGGIAASVMATPGHTPDSVSYVVGDAVFVGDTLFMPDCGTARCDFPGGDARVLYRSIRRILDLPPATRLYVCHDYPYAERPDARVETTVAAQRADNIHVPDSVSEDAFIAMREARDATLAMPQLILPAVQVNMRAGRFPAPEANGTRYLKIPVDRF